MKINYYRGPFVDSLIIFGGRTRLPKPVSVEVQVPPHIPHPTVPADVTATEDDTPVIVGGYYCDTIGVSHVTLRQTKDKRVVDVMVELQLL